MGNDPTMNFFKKLFESPPKKEKEAGSEKLSEKAPSDPLPKKESGPKELFEKSLEERVLESREKERSDRLDGGSNVVELVKLRNNGSGVFKPRDGEY